MVRAAPQQVQTCIRYDGSIGSLRHLQLHLCKIYKVSLEVSDAPNARRGTGLSTPQVGFLSLSHCLPDLLGALPHRMGAHY